MLFLGYKISTVLPNWPVKRQIIVNTINPHSYCVAEKDKLFKEALLHSDILVPDGIGVVCAARILHNEKIKRITGADVHQHLLDIAQKNKLKIFYLGASKKTLEKIRKKLANEYSEIQVELFSPPFKPKFSLNDERRMVDKVNSYSPDILFVGMTAPKQEKWVNANKGEIKTQMIVSIGAVFDFYADTVKRAPNWIINIHLEWLYRFLKEPKRLWKRYIINSVLFIKYVLRNKLESY